MWVRWLIVAVLVQWGLEALIYAVTDIQHEGWQRWVIFAMTILVGIKAADDYVRAVKNRRKKS